MLPLISIVLPVYNSKKYISETLFSILNQTEKRFELIIILDFPTDGTEDIVNSVHDERIKLIRHSENKGVSFTRNEGISLSVGKYIIFMDHDDILPKTRLALHLSFLEEHPEYDALGGKIIAIDSDSNFNHVVYENVPQDSDYIRAFLMNQNLLINSSVTYRLNTIKKYHLSFWENSFGLEDYVFIVALSKVGKITNLQDISLFYRMHPGNTLKKIIDNNLKERLDVWEKFFRFSYETEGFELSDDDYKMLVHVFSEKRHGVPLDFFELGNFFILLDKIVKQGIRLKLSYIDKLFICLNEIRCKIASEQLCFNIIPFSLEELYTFCKKFKNIYIYGHGKYGRQIENILIQLGFSITKFVVSENANLKDNEISVSNLILSETDGLIIGLNKKNTSDVKKIINDKFSEKQLLIQKL